MNSSALELVQHHDISFEILDITIVYTIALV